ncbi:hypothetical protein C8R44DRAFT_900981 [Mycena epipterygia]|nr:hypothetical protein C8R44DRAFT_900981 [Mycena epipterygia]
MFALRFASLLLLSATFVSALPTPAAGLAVVGRQSNTDIESVLNTLKSSTDKILPQITAMGKDAKSANLTPLLNDLTAALKTASGSLEGLFPGIKRQSVDGLLESLEPLLKGLGLRTPSTLSDVSKRQSDELLGLLGVVVNDLNLGGLLPAAKRQSTADVAALAGTIVTGIATALDNALGTVFAGVDNLLGTAFAGVDGVLGTAFAGVVASLKVVLVDLNTLSPGMLTTFSNLVPAKTGL